MKLLWILIVAITLLFRGVLNIKDGSSVTTESLVKKHHYPFEKHKVETSDGYILTLHRIPYSARVDTPSPRPVAFLMHGLLCSSSDWVILGPENALGYMLSDVGYDVWLGNARGNRYSRHHVTLSSQSKSFWNFSWHEIGVIDLPAMIDYILSHTGQHQLRYFGHSQGTTTFLILNSLHPKFKSRFKSAHLLAPAIFMNHAKSPVLKIAAPFLGQPNEFVELFASVELLPNTKGLELIGNTACKATSPVQILCANVIFLIAGFDQENLDTNLLPEIFATFPAGSSMKQVVHYVQSYKSGHFRHYDYGSSRNSLRYGSKAPPDYPLKKIDVPIFLYYGSNDFLVGVPDVHTLISKLSNSTLKRAYKVPHPKWNHFDFTWGLNVKEQLYDAVMEDVSSIK